MALSTDSLNAPSYTTCLPKWSPWGRVRWDWVNSIRLWFAPMPQQLGRAPNIAPFFLLIVAGNFTNPGRPTAKNSSWLTFPELGLRPRRDLATKEGAHRMEAFRRFVRFSTSGTDPSRHTSNATPGPLAAQIFRRSEGGNRTRRRMGRPLRRNDRRGRRPANQLIPADPLDYRVVKIWGRPPTLPRRSPGIPTSLIGAQRVVFRTGLGFAR